MCPTCTEIVAPAAVTCPTCGAPLRRPTLAARAAQWLRSFDGEVGSPPRSIRVEGVDEPLTVIFGFFLVTFVVLCVIGSMSWLGIPLLVGGSAGTLFALGRGAGLKWPLRMVLVLLGEPVPAFSSRFVNRPSNRAPHVVSLRGDHHHLDEGDALRLLVVSIDGSRHALWLRHRTSGAIWFAAWIGWLVLFGWLAAVALMCS